VRAGTQRPLEGGDPWVRAGAQRPLEGGDPWVRAGAQRPLAGGDSDDHYDDGRGHPVRAS